MSDVIWDSASGSSPAVELRNRAMSFMPVQALRVAAELSIADLIAEEPKSAEDLAAATDTDAGVLYRLLRALSSSGIFCEMDDGRFSNTALSEALRTDVADSARDYVIFITEDMNVMPWRRLNDAVRTGDATFEAAMGSGPWEYVGGNPEAGRLFGQAMTVLTAQLAGEFLDVYDLSGATKVVDLGGGYGLLLASILKRYPAMQGLLLELPSVVDDAAGLLESQGVGSRVEIVAGDFLESVPAGGDVYVMKHVLHDWTDTDVVKILENVRSVIPDDGRVVVLDAVIGEPNQPQVGKWLDLHMHVGAGARERTGEEFAAIFDQTGFRLSQILNPDGMVATVEALPV